MALQQLNLKLPAELVAQWRAQAAAAGHRSIRDWLVAITAAPGVAAAAAAPSELEARLEALETAVAALRQQSRPSRGCTKEVQPPIPQPAVEPRQKDRPIRPATIPQTGDAPAAAITTAELATRTGTNRAGWNNWAVDHELGEVRDHPQAGRWKLTGKAAPESGGPARWLWEPA